MDMTAADLRKQRGLAIAQVSRLKRIVHNTWLVPSQTATGGYVVDVEKGTCSCPDHELRGAVLRCKHRWAVEFARHHVLGPDGTPVVVDTMRVTYSQDWSSYNKAQVEEKDRFGVLLKSICEGVQTVPHAGRGRPRTALSDVIFGATMKTFVGLSGRRASSDIRAAEEKGLIEDSPSYNTIFSYLGSPDVTPILKKLVRVSSAPLAIVESRFAVDGTGFSSHSYARWLDIKHKFKAKKTAEAEQPTDDAKKTEGKKKREGVKLHAIIGTTTKVVTAVEVTEATLHDSPLLPQLVRETSETFTMEEVSADKGYIGNENLQVIESVGAKPYVAFRSNNKVTSKSTDAWKRAFHMFAFHRDEWLVHYNQRSNVEAAFSAIKRKFGPHLRTINHDAQVNEALTKVLAHNVSCLVHAIHEMGVEPVFWKDVPKIGGAS